MGGRDKNLKIRMVWSREMAKTKFGYLPFAPPPSSFRCQQAYGCGKFCKITATKINETSTFQYYSPVIAILFKCLQMAPSCQGTDCLMLSNDMQSMQVKIYLDSLTIDFFVLLFSSMFCCCLSSVFDAKVSTVLSSPAPVQL